MFWKDGNSTGLATILQLLCSLTIDTNPLLPLIGKMAANFAVEDLEIAFDFLLSDIAGGKNYELCNPCQTRRKIYL